MDRTRSAGQDIGALEGSEMTEGPAGGAALASWSENGRDWSDVRSELLARKSQDFDWQGGRIPIYVYYDDEDLLSVSREAYGIYFSENALGKQAFPSLAQMERDIIAMSLSLFGAPKGAGGSFTSGGTESIFLAVKTARDAFVSSRGHGGGLSIIVPRTAHPAFDKAAHCLGLRVSRVNIGEDLKACVDEIRNAIDHHTLMIVASAPCYPYGVYDPIIQLAELASSTGVWLHVDACLGGFLAPFVREIGISVPAFDFSIEGVTSLSADLHKHGFAAKGASVLLYRSAELKSHQSFRFDSWPRGTYSTETFLGSRPGGSIASAWAVLQYLGKAGYRRLAKKTMSAKQHLSQGIGDIPGIEVIQPSELSILLYKSVDARVDINAVSEALMERGWFVGKSRDPEAIHLALNAVHAPIVDEYLADLRSVVEEVRTSARVGTRGDATY